MRTFAYAHLAYAHPTSNARTLVIYIVVNGHPKDITHRNDTAALHSSMSALVPGSSFNEDSEYYSDLFDSFIQMPPPTPGGEVDDADVLATFSEPGQDIELNGNSNFALALPIFPTVHTGLESNHEDILPRSNLDLQTFFLQLVDVLEATGFAQAEAVAVALHLVVGNNSSSGIAHDKPNNSSSLSAHNHTPQPDALEPEAKRQMQGPTTSSTTSSPAIQPPEVATSVPSLYDRPAPCETSSLAPGTSTLPTRIFGGFDRANPNVCSPGPETTATSVRMDVPLVLNATEEAIKYFIAAFKQEVGNHVPWVQCSLCAQNPNARTQEHDPRPCMLERHLFSHFGVKTYECTRCWKQFTTRDQAVRHSARRHSTTQEAMGGSVRRLNV